MGYIVRYGQTKHVRKYVRRPHFAFPVVILAAVLSFVIASQVWPEEIQQLRMALFPWEREPVRQAISQLHNDLREGDTVTDAITAFCLEVLKESDAAQ